MDFNNSYARLPEKFYQRINPVAVENPELIRVNHSLATELALDLPEDDNALAALFSGNAVIEGMDPVAMAYAGHQFGGFVPQLGDGRAVLLGEVISNIGKRFDIQLKGSGQTRFSRNGDGRSALGPVIREYIVSEAMHALGVPTSRALAMVTTGERVFREGPVPGGIFTRVASGLVRVGTFEYFAARNDVEAVRHLADYVIDRHYPEAKSAANPYIDLFRRVCEATAQLIASWMEVGFIHGVMNTDNTSICGETIDYGPCAFMDTYVPDKVFSSIDHAGRYAYNNQPTIGQWNMAALGGCLLGLFDDDVEKARAIGEEELKIFIPAFKKHYMDRMCRKIGLNSADERGFQLVRNLMQLMHQNHVDFTIAFRELSEDMNRFTALFAEIATIEPWVAEWSERIARQGESSAVVQERMCATNPVYIPRNHQIERAIRAAEDQNDFSLTHQLINILKTPYTVQSSSEIYIAPPKPEEVVRQTFCGT
ncbi:protein adenylyltransferase SelO [Maridesulfovibrio frigidus]|uniref:protein adenylyltransferase SelO n=1 Tax=Maridesulfovibrio frigidus TaxID=340956 RepID=UPI0004E269E1|nr:YdiU family protein [Maridesulfovibrio frigidus]